MRGRQLLALLFGATTACSVDDARFDRAHLADAIVEASGHGIAPEATLEPSAPADVELDDGVDEEEAVALALWNNADFQSAISELGIARARLVEAGLLRNPSFSILFPVGPKQLEFALTVPLESIWLRPERVAAAELDCEHVATLLVQGGLDLVRDVRTAFAALRHARRRAALAGDELDVLRRIATFEQVRVAAGDTRERDLDIARIAALDAERARRQAEQDVRIAEERVRALVGYQLAVPELGITTADRIAVPDLDAVDAILPAALAARPDVRAADLQLGAAGQRAELADGEWATLSAIVDANGAGKEGFEIGPGLAFEVPLFHAGGGRRGIARAELETATRRSIAARHRVTAELIAAHARAAQARDDLTVLVDGLLPAVDAAHARAQRAFELGDVSRAEVLAAELQAIATRLRVATAEAALATALADLEHALGRRLSTLEIDRR